MQKIKTISLNLYHFLKQVIHDYMDDHGSLVAAAVSFYVFLSVVPLILLAIATVGYLLGSPERAADIVFRYVNEYFPTSVVGQELDIRSVIDEIVLGRSAATGIGLVTLIWTGTNTIVNLEKAINVAWNVGDRRHFFAQRALGILILFSMFILLTASFTLTSGLNAIRNMEYELFGVAPGDWPFIWRLVGFILPLAVSVSTFTGFYKVMPNTRVPLRVALVGGITAGVLWEFGKQVFSYYVTNYAAYSKVYGSLAGAILLLVWINYSSVIVIFGAEVASLRQKLSNGSASLGD